MTEIQVYPDPASLARAAAELIIQQAHAAAARQGVFNFALSGGSTPQQTFAELARPEAIGRMPWGQAEVFWSDERCVPPDHPQSNYRMAQAALLDHVPVPASQIHRMQGEISPPNAARAYEQVLRGRLATQEPAGDGEKSFDLVMLGLGSDGHTASLFPGTEVLRVTDRWVAANRVPALDSWRITLTTTGLNAAAFVLFLIAGASKAAILREVIRGKVDRYPAQLIRPANGKVVWMVDEAAARLI
jgi:6-phosphogluconolactonase